MFLSPTHLRAARAALDWTQDDLARSSGVGLDTIRRIEQGGDYNVSTGQKLADAFKAAGVLILYTSIDWQWVKPAASPAPDLAP